MRQLNEQLNLVYLALLRPANIEVAAQGTIELNIQYKQYSYKLGPTHTCKRYRHIGNRLVKKKGGLAMITFDDGRGRGVKNAKILIT